jgi:hypothetical protein
VNGEALKETYFAGSILTFQVVTNNPVFPFSGWLGENIAGLSSPKAA